MIRRSIRPSLVLTTVFWLTVLLNGCGQTGPLYLPEDGKPTGEAPEQSAFPTPQDTH